MPPQAAVNWSVPESVALLANEPVITKFAMTMGGGKIVTTG